VIWGAGQALTVIDGTAVSSAMFGGSGYTVRDLSIGHAGRHISTSQTCDGNDGLCGVAFAARGLTLLNMRCFDNGTSCAGYGTGDVIMDGVECDNNGWHPSMWQISAACVKITTAGGNLTVRNSNIHDNYWAGLWGDFCGLNSTNNCVWLIENNQIIHNGGIGVMWEVSGNHNAGDSAIVRFNTIQNGGWNTFQRAGAAAVVNNDSSNLEVNNNIFGNNLYWFSGQSGLVCCEGMINYEGTRDPAAMYNDYIHDNTLNGDHLDYCAPTNPGVICTNNTP
jgi:hypothetical protein